MTSPTLALAEELIARPSITPDDAGCQGLLSAHLERLGFAVEPMRFGEVDNFWAQHGTTSPLLVFAGHTDVVPPGPWAQWRSPPFAPTLRDGFLYGRGAADMKGSLAAMVSACEAFIGEHPDHRGTLAWLITSDEEGPSIDGTVKVVEILETRGEKIDYCLVGEPSSHTQVGDVIKNGRRGSLNGTLTVRGEQGHVAYPDRASNPIHAAAPALAELCATPWDLGNDHFPATALQIAAIHAGTGARNVIPGELVADFNFRFSTEVTEEQLQVRVQALLERYGLDYTLQWHLSGKPFLTPGGALLDAVCSAVEEVTGHPPQRSTVGGTSDGRFIAPTGAQVVELGPVNASIHKIDECVRAEDLDILAKLYQRTLEKLLT